jgi:hypothetical protein
MDSINMTGQPDGEYKHIIHYVDHYSKFHILWPTTSLRAEEVAVGFK